MTQRKLVYYIATSIDHYIERLDGSFDGMELTGPHATDYLTSLRDYDTVLMGKGTYEAGYRWGAEPGQPSATYPHMMQYVFSQSMEAYDHPQLKVIREDAAAFTRKLKAQAGGSIYLCGGGQLAGSLMAAGLVDELILKVNPVVWGKGIPLFGDLDQCFRLNLLDTKVYHNGVIFTHYAVVNG